MSMPLPPSRQIPIRPKKTRTTAMAGGLVILDWLFLAVCGLGVGCILVALSVLAAMI